MVLMNSLKSLLFSPPIPIVVTEAAYQLMKENYATIFSKLRLSSFEVLLRKSNSNQIIKGLETKRNAMLVLFIIFTTT